MLQHRWYLQWQSNHRDNSLACRIETLLLNCVILFWSLLWGPFWILTEQDHYLSWCSWRKRYRLHFQLSSPLHLQECALGDRIDYFDKSVLQWQLIRQTNVFSSRYTYKSFFALSFSENGTGIVWIGVAIWVSNILKPTSTNYLARAPQQQF